MEGGDPPCLWFCALMQRFLKREQNAQKFRTPWKPAMQSLRCGPKVEVCQHGSHLFRPHPSSPSLQTLEWFRGGIGDILREGLVLWRPHISQDLMNSFKIWCMSMYFFEYIILYRNYFLLSYTTHHISKCCCELLGDCAKKTKLWNKLRRAPNASQKNKMCDILHTTFGQKAARWKWVNIAFKCNCRRPVSCAFCFSVLVALFLHPFPSVGISRNEFMLKSATKKPPPFDHLRPFCSGFQLSLHWFMILHLARSFYIRILGQARECAAGPTDTKNQHPKMPAAKNPRKTSIRVE